ncbi:MAG: hypothetical protein ACP5N2_05910 [Candidatus Nanoarchaeia archaeon]
MVKKNKSKVFFSKDNILVHIIIVVFVGVCIMYFGSAVSIVGALFLFVSVSVFIYVLYLVHRWRDKMIIASKERIVIVENTKSMKDIVPESSKLTKVHQLAVLTQEGYTDEQIYSEAKKYKIGYFRMWFALQFQKSPISTFILYVILVLGILFVFGTIIGEIFY